MSDYKHGSQKKRRYGSSNSSSSSSSSLSKWAPRKAFRKSLTPSSRFSAERQFTETINYGTVDLKVGLTFTGGVVYITAAMLGNIASASGLFDTYKIRKFIVKFIPCGQQVFNVPSANGGVPSTSGVSQLTTAVDPDDGNAPSSVNQVMEYETCKFAGPGKQHTRVMMGPKVSAEFYETIVTTGYGSRKQQWLDIASDDVPHYGVKWAISYPAPAATIQMYRIIVVVHYSCKDQR